MNGAVIQDYTALQSVDVSSSHQDYKLYRLYFNEPVLCKMGEKCDFCFELDECLNRYIYMKGFSEANFKSVKFDFRSGDYFVDSLVFNDIS